MTITQPFDELSKWMLDHDGDIYGVDERERLRWYEGIAVAASVQWLLVPVVLAIVVWVGGRPVAPAMLAVSVAFFLPMSIANSYVARHRVSTTPVRWTRKRIIVLCMSGIPLLVLIVGFARAFGFFEQDTRTVVWTLVGGFIGMAIAAICMVVIGRRKRGGIDADEDFTTAGDVHG